MWFVALGICSGPNVHIYLIHNPLQLRPRYMDCFYACYVQDNLLNINISVFEVNRNESIESLF